MNYTLVVALLAATPAYALIAGLTLGVLERIAPVPELATPEQEVNHGTMFLFGCILWPASAVVLLFYFAGKVGLRIARRHPQGKVADVIPFKGGDR